MGALHAQELMSGYFHISEVDDDVWECFLNVVKVVPFVNIIGEGKCPCMDDEVQHFVY